MTQPVGLAVTHRARLGAADSFVAGGVADPSRILALFADVARELLIRLDGDEGVLRSLQQVEMLAPVYAGDFVEASGVVTKIGATSRQIAFEARKLITYARPAAGEGAGSAADALVEPIVVCRALATCVVARALQRHPRLVLPALPPALGAGAGSLPEGRAIVTPAPHVVVTPPRETPPEVMIAASIVGGGVTREHTPHVPVSPEEIAEEARRCRDSGASIVWLGVEPRTRAGVACASDLAAIVEAVRASCELPIVVSATAPGVFDPEAHAALLEVGADLVALPGGSFNLGDAVVQAPRPRVRQALAAMAGRRRRAMLECFELGHLDEAMALGRDRLLDVPLRVQLVLGVPGALGASDEALRLVASRVPKRTAWFVAGVGRYQRRVTESALRLGGCVRVGLADNIYLRRGVLAEGTAGFVERAASFARAIGREPVAAARAMQLLGLDATDEQAAADDSPAAAPPGDDPAGPSEAAAGEGLQAQDLPAS
jgi:3-keto-5-aminohexanoate cleavage enzyme